MTKEKFGKGGTIHKTKASANKIATSCRNTGVHYRIRKLKGGYRVDKHY